MHLSADEIAHLRDLLLGIDGRWDSGELARVLCAGLTLAAIEHSPGLLSLPWPQAGPDESSPVTVRQGLSTMLESGDDSYLKALIALTNTRKPLTNRLTEVAEVFGQTSSRTGRNKLKTEILPWFFDHLINRLQRTSDRLRTSGLNTPADSASPHRLTPLADRGFYRSELQAPIDPAELARALKGRLVQAALDVSDLDEAARLAQLAALNGADIIEVGDPLIKRYGIETAVQRIRATASPAPRWPSSSAPPTGSTTSSTWPPPPAPTSSTSSASTTPAA